MSAGGPRTALKNAFQLDLIENSDEKLWISILEDRNLMPYTYRSQLADEIVERVKNDYFPIMKSTLEKLKSLKNL